MRRHLSLKIKKEVMALKTKYNLIAYEADTAAEIADTVFKSNELVTSLDDGVTKKGDGVTEFSELPVLGGGGDGEVVTWATLTGKPATFAPIIGTTAATALAGNTAIPTWANISGKPAVIGAGADAAAARAAIGAGTSNVALPATMTAAQAETGTATTALLISPKVLADEIDRRIAAIPAP